MLCLFRVRLHKNIGLCNMLLEDFNLKPKWGEVPVVSPYKNLHYNKHYLNPEEKNWKKFKSNELRFKTDNKRQLCFTPSWR